MKSSICSVVEAIPVVVFSLLSMSKAFQSQAGSYTQLQSKFVMDSHEQSNIELFSVYLTIIPRARMGYESIVHEAEGRMGY